VAALPVAAPAPVADRSLAGTARGVLIDERPGQRLDGAAGGVSGERVAVGAVGGRRPQQARTRDGVGLGGRERRAASVAERARTNVQRRIRDAIARIEKCDPELGRYLGWTVRTGTFCVFDPDGARAKG